MTRDDVQTAWAMVSSILRNTNDDAAGSDADRSAATQADFAALIAPLGDDPDALVRLYGALLMICVELVKAWSSTYRALVDDTVPFVGTSAIGMFVNVDTPAFGIVFETWKSTVAAHMTPIADSLSVTAIIEQMSVAFAQLPETF